MSTVSIDISFEPEDLAAKAEGASLVGRAITAAVEAFAPEGDYEVSVLITDDESIRKLNREYRDKDVHTDVLSFPQLEEDEAYGPEELPRLLGDIVISMETASRQAEDFGHGIDREVAYLAVHGALHLLGYDHIEAEDKAEMRLAEEAVLKGMGLERIQDQEQ